MTDFRTADEFSEERQQRYARLAGFLFLWLIFTGLAGQLIISHVLGSGQWAEVSARVAGSQGLYRIALISELIETVSAALLGFALYVTLRPVDEVLAQLALYFRLGESFVGTVGVVFGFMKLNLYLSNKGAQPEQIQALLALLRQAGNASYNIGASLFGIGSILFCYLLLKSRYIPVILSWIGIIASVIVPIMCVGSLLFPEYSAKLQYGWAPMAIAEVSIGIYMMIFGVKRSGVALRHDR